ncbi:MAG: tRNA threonylcarbamoyladenosine biosynthesis protein [Candidatus Peribacteria bacterium]|nr:tRNA threonylcarbamoyladenosine biosynthesis protein [Candidatus Peribacteria bacterium]
MAFMKLLPVTNGENLMTLHESLNALQKGLVIAHPTETCYGLACDLTNKKAVERLFAIKQRPVMQPLSALFASVWHAQQYVEWNDMAEKIAQKHLPGPLTLILPLRGSAPYPIFVTPDGGRTIGVRISSHPFTSELAAGFHHPLSTTSANLHGFPEPYCDEDVMSQYADQPLQPDVLLQAGSLSVQPPSTILDLTGKEIRVVRQGSISIDVHQL